MNDAETRGRVAMRLEHQKARIRRIEERMHLASDLAFAMRRYGQNDELTRCEADALVQKVQKLRVRLKEANLRVYALQEWLDEMTEDAR